MLRRIKGVGSKDIIWSEDRTETGGEGRGGYIGGVLEGGKESLVRSVGRSVGRSRVCMYVMQVVAAKKIPPFITL